MATPTKALTDELATILAADTGSLGAALALNVHLIAEAFVPGPLTDFAALTEATFTGSAAKGAGAAPQQVFNDPGSGLKVVQMKEPSGGWSWVCTADPASPETIHGWCLTSNNGLITWMSELLPAPVVIAAAGDAINVPWVRGTFRSPVMS